MEKNPICVYLYLVGCRSRFGRLSGSKTDDSPFLVIVSLASVPNVASLFKLQKQRIDAIIEPDKIHTVGCFVHVNHTDQRVQRFETVQPVIQVHIIQIKYLIHNRKYQTYRKYKKYPYITYTIPVTKVKDNPDIFTTPITDYITFVTDFMP